MRPIHMFMRMLIVIAALSTLAACSFKILKTVDDTESTWRPVDAPPAPPGAPPAPVGPDHGY